MIREGIDLKNRFQNSIDNKPIIGCVMKYHEVKSSDYYQNIVFVEGSSDKLFYIHTHIGKLHKKPYYIYASQADDMVGKTAVVESYKMIVNDKCLVDGLDKCVFIVDQDWDEKPEGVCITKWHSMENYFLQEDNLKVLFDMAGKQANYTGFLNEYKKFCLETANFWALKATASYAKKQGIRCFYRKKHSFEEIFCFSLDEKRSIKYNRRYMDDEISEMRNAIMGSKELISIYNNLYKKIKGNINFVRGHEAFRFLQCYFFGCFGIEIDLYSKEQFLNKCIKGFNVELIAENGVLS